MVSLLFAAPHSLKIGVQLVNPFLKLVLVGFNMVVQMLCIFSRLAVAVNICQRLFHIICDSRIDEQ